MKSPYRLLCALLACLPLTLAAQPAPKIFVIDMGKVFEAHPQTQQQQAALKAEEKKVTEQLQRLEKEIRTLRGQTEGAADAASTIRRCRRPRRKRFASRGRRWVRNCRPSRPRASS